jgi:glycosyltransferase involved in cell wall biosynthesis
MPNSSTLFSIIVPTYNRAHLISVTIESILSQGYPNYEIIIVDDGSTDNTEEVIQKYLCDKVIYYKKINGERATARNYGTNKAKGDYVNWFDSDDVMFPDHLQVAASFVLKCNKPEIFALSHQYQHITGRVLNILTYPEDINSELYKGNLLANSPVIVRRDVALANLFNEDRELSGSEDFELWLRLASKYRILSSPKITLAVIDHEERSMITMTDPDQLIKRFTKFIHYTTSDAGVLSLLGKHKDVFVMKNYLILAVSLVNNNNPGLGYKYLRLAFASSPALIFQRGFFAFLKHYAKYMLSPPLTFQQA